MGFFDGNIDGPFDSIFDFNRDGHLDPFEKGAEMGLIVNALEEESKMEETDIMSIIPDCCLGCPNHPMNGGSATCAFCPHAVDGQPPQA